MKENQLKNSSISREDPKKKSKVHISIGANQRFQARNESKQPSRMDTRSRARSSRISRINSLKEEESESQLKPEKVMSQENLIILEPRLDTVPAETESPHQRRRITSEAFNLTKKDSAQRKIRRINQGGASIISSRMSPVYNGDIKFIKEFIRNNTESPSLINAGETGRFGRHSYRMDIPFEVRVAKYKGSVIFGEDESPRKYYSSKNTIRGRPKMRQMKTAKTRGFAQKATLFDNQLDFEEKVKEKEKTANLDILIPIQSELESLNSLNQSQEKDRRDRLVGSSRKHMASKKVIIQSQGKKEEQNNLSKQRKEIVAITPDLRIKMAKRFKPRPVINSAVMSYSQDVKDYFAEFKKKTITQILLSRKDWCQASVQLK